MAAQLPRIAVTGAGGMLGTAMVQHLAGRHQVFAAGRSPGLAITGVTWHAFDLLDHSALAGWIQAVRPDAVVHCAALVNVDACEKNVTVARALHAGTTAVIADELAKRPARLVYISTDSVFDGRKSGPYVEYDPTAPPNVYAATQLEGEGVALAASGVVLRTNIFGWSRAERTSFAEWVLKGLVEQAPLTMFRDVLYTPIHVTHLAEVTADVIAQDVSGLFHATGSAVLSKYDFALRLAAAFNLSDAHIRSISVDDAGLSANRPKNMALANHRLQSALNRALPGVDEGIALFKRQHDNGKLAKIKSRPVRSNGRFWEIA